MRTKAQKQEDLKKGRELLEKSQALVFVDFTKVSTQGLRKLRADLKAANAKLFIIKKRLLSLLLKEKGIEFDTKAQKLYLGVVFSESDSEAVSGPVYKFFAGLEVPEGGAKDMWAKHIIGGYDVKAKAPVSAEQIVFIGKLPPREVLLAQLLGMLAAPLRSFMYLVQEKSKQQTQ
ncbi:MAG: 50S ribosomal protein L10 [Patescibacteria group bacterium]